MSAHQAYRTGSQPFSKNEIPRVDVIGSADDQDLVPADRDQRISAPQEVLVHTCKFNFSTPIGPVPDNVASPIGSEGECVRTGTADQIVIFGSASEHIVAVEAVKEVPGIATAKRVIAGITDNNGVRDDPAAVRLSSTGMTAMIFCWAAREVIR